VAYKADVSDTRESPELDVTHLLLEKGATVSYHDPFVPEVQEQDVTLRSVPDLIEALADSDCVVVVTNHFAYDWPVVREHAKLVVDTRHAITRPAEESSFRSVEGREGALLA
jgi:UDP-N-acetyl-D-glucosamine dehydrogenase